MQNKAGTITPLHHIAETVELLNASSTQLIQVMNRQIDAIITSNTAEIEQLSEDHASVSQQFKTHETKFIAELENILGVPKQKTLRMLDMKKMFPECEVDIDAWHKMLSDNSKTLQRKHEQVMQLLEFAMNQNAKLMHSVYSLHNEKNTHYGANGNRSNIMTGVAVNQEI